ncbi:MAG: glycosyl hydrolase 53 family protein [Bacteroidota bacterium]
MKSFLAIVLVSISSALILHAQPYLGVDLSYVNEMEDCGVVYKEAGAQKDPYQIFADAGANLVRLRLWHTPSWYDTLNSGERYSDLADVKRSIARAKEAGMQVLLDFHLSDNWADPSKQIIPAAWLAVADDLTALQDSLEQYLYSTLTELAAEDLWPDLIQLGNETNRGILLTPTQNESGWVLDWERNGSLFNRGLQAIRSASADAGESVKVGLHLAGPANVEWFVEQFVEHEVTDFDFVGISYYWAWHQPTTIAEAGQVVNRLHQAYPDKEIIILETGYVWTTEWNDQAANIISDTHPDYAPPSPTAQLNWLVDLTETVLQNGGHGVLSWEPAWVSSGCFTQWGQGSHQEHATFFDFSNEVIPDGGIAWLGRDYTTSTFSPIASPDNLDIRAIPSPDGRRLKVSFIQPTGLGVTEASLINIDGKRMASWIDLTVSAFQIELVLPELSNGIYFFVARDQQGRVGKEAVVIQR